MSAGRGVPDRSAEVEPVGVVGLGVVGATVRDAFEEAGVPTRGYDPYLGSGSAEDLAPCGVSFLCVGTPGAPGGGHDLSQVWSAMAEMGHHLRPEAIVAVKSTVPPGTADRLAAAHSRIIFVSAPEFMVAADPRDTFRHPDRIVVGARARRDAEAVARLLSIVAPEAPIAFLSPTEAELVKLCANAMLAAKVTMANELSEICVRFGVDWSRVRGVVGQDPRIGLEHTEVTPERGFGGACLPKDLDGLISVSGAAGYPPAVLEAIAEFNRRVREDAEASRDGQPVPLRRPIHPGRATRASEGSR